MRRRFSASSALRSSMWLSGCSPAWRSLPGVIAGIEAGLVWTEATAVRLDTEAVRRCRGVGSTDVSVAAASDESACFAAPISSGRNPAGGPCGLSSGGARRSGDGTGVAAGFGSSTVGLATEGAVTGKIPSASTCRATACRSRLPQMEEGLVMVCRLFALYSTTKERCGVFISRQFHRQRQRGNPAAQRYRQRILLS
ncbi:hypothetical protein ACVMH6_001904 [Rhizobium leguminosarum]